MRLELTGRHIKITPTLHALLEGGLSHALRKLNNSAVSVQVVLTKEKTRVHAEATLHVKGERFLHGEATGRDARTALAAVLDKVDRQAQKVKNKWTDGKRQGVSASKAGSAAPRPERAGRRFGGGQEPAGAEEGVRIVRARRYPVKPMSVDEAALEMSDSPSAFIVFRDARTEAINILFRRPDGNLGLIEPES
jgi:putative sigma-54 modulation protein